ncbi:transferrin-binding protein-like solute binding protein [Moraxella lacunata]|uniref:transferrin-binding protein-like solute binding protein n=1 Tax=Moraxella lacunata TaxID=477 RepID=UPI001301F239|nr:transferrin-binding protein-like solute binding protein [Moraxella lacunata]
MPPTPSNQGTNPATALPTQTITYKGTWNFMTDAKKGRGSDEFHSEYKKNAGADYSAFSFHESTKDDAKWRDEGRTGDVSHTSVFTVDFANKTLTGELSRHKSKSEKVKRYDIKADIKDNRFRGSATASNPNDPFFKSNSKSLEGGFFGANAEELAGKFLADDNSLFAVFGARQHKDGNRAEFGVNFDNKTLKGTLYAGGSVAPSIIIDNGVISGNGFTADFRTGEKGLSLDKSSISGAVAHLSGKVDGGFYGKNATELGGSFYSERTSKKDGVAGVFGAKQQVKK